MPIPNIILERTPDYIEPVNTPLWFETSSTASNVQDFKYLFKVDYKNEGFDVNSFIQLPTLYKVPPRPSDGHGFFTPNQVLKGYFQYHVSPFQKGWNSGFVGAIGSNPGLDNGYFQYRLRYGFEYNPQLQFSQTYNYLGQLALSFSVAPGFQAGDLIIIDKDNKFVNSYYDGTASVIGTQSATQIITDVPFGVAVNNETGNIINLQRISATTSTFHTFNGTRQYHELDKDYSTYIMGYTPSVLGEFLTDYPFGGTAGGWGQPKTIYIGCTSGGHSYETLSMINNSFTSSICAINIYDSSDNSITGASFVILSTNKYRRLEVGIGPQNIEDLFGTGFYDFTTDQAAYYTVQILRGVTPLSPLLRYDLRRQCYQETEGFIDNEEPQTIIFLNRKGGWDYFTFIKDKVKTSQIQRDEWYRTLPIDYQYGLIYRDAERGRSNLNTFVEETYTIQSDWIRDYESAWLESLFTSPEVYLIVNGKYVGGTQYTDFTGRYIPITILDTAYETRTYMRNQMFNVKLSYKFAIPTNLQNQ